MSLITIKVLIPNKFDVKKIEKLMKNSPSKKSFIQKQHNSEYDTFTKPGDSNG